MTTHGAPVPAAGDAQSQGICGMLVSMLVTAVILLCAGALNGCAGLQESYVGADGLTFKAIAPVYLRYTEADPELDERAKERRRRLIRSWEGRIEEGERHAR